MIDVPKTREALRLAIDGEDLLLRKYDAERAALEVLSAALGQAQEAWREADGICYPDHDGGMEATHVLILPADATAEEVTK